MDFSYFGCRSVVGLYLVRLKYFCFFFCFGCGSRRSVCGMFVECVIYEEHFCLLVNHVAYTDSRYRLHKIWYEASIKGSYSLRLHHS